MARPISVIQQSLVDAVQADATLSGLLTSNSKVAIWRLWCFVVAVCIWTQENLYDIFKSDVNTIISSQKPHNATWYASKARAFQFGYNLPNTDTDIYDNTGLTDDQIAASKIVNFVAVKEEGKKLRIKVATLVDDELAPLTNEQLTALIAYFQQIKDAGVFLNITTGAADGLKLTADVYYNALVLNDNGNRLDGTEPSPVQNAINNYLKNIAFNGQFALQNLIDVLQVIDGVKFINITLLQAQYGLLPYTGFAVYYDPDAGYLRFINDNDLKLNFIPYSE